MSPRFAERGNRSCWSCCFSKGKRGALRAVHSKGSLLPAPEAPRSHNLLSPGRLMARERVPGFLHHRGARVPKKAIPRQNSRLPD